jgi:phosphatidylserine decarboxylase
VGEGLGIAKAPDLRDRLAVLPQYLVPQRMLTVLAGKFAALRARWWTGRVIPWFIARYGVNMTTTRGVPGLFARNDNGFGQALIRAGASSPCFESCCRDGAGL